MSAHLGDDGTMDTVICCDECGEEMRYMYDPDPQGGQVESYDEFVEWAISDFDEDHECSDSETTPGAEAAPGAVPTPASPAPVNGESGGASGAAMQAPCPGCEYAAVNRDDGKAPPHNCKAPHWHYCAKCEMGHRCNETTCRGIPNRNCR